MLIAGRNFGCGSSREHAAWALDDYGFRVVIAPSFGDIFRTNAIKTGLAPIVLGEAELAAVKRAVAERNELGVDLEAQRDRTSARPARSLRASTRTSAQTLLEGLDDVARTLQRAEEIAAFETTHPARFDLAAIR